MSDGSAGTLDKGDLKLTMVVPHVETVPGYHQACDSKVLPATSAEPLLHDPSREFPFQLCRWCFTLSSVDAVDSTRAWKQKLLLNQMLLKLKSTSCIFLVRQFLNNSAEREKTPMFCLAVTAWKCPQETMKFHILRYVSHYRHKKKVQLWSTV